MSKSRLNMDSDGRCIRIIGVVRAVRFNKGFEPEIEVVCQCISDGRNTTPALSYSALAAVPAARASAFVRKPPFEIDFLFPSTLAHPVC